MQTEPVIASFHLAADPRDKPEDDGLLVSEERAESVWTPCRNAEDIKVQAERLRYRPGPNELVETT
jgi:hypothetical protein